MALDLSERDDPRLWFGFSPIVVIALVVVLAGGGVAFARSRADPYVEALVELCAASDAALRRPYGEVGGKPGSPFQHWGGAAATRLAQLRPMDDVGGHDADHAKLMAAETELVRRAEEGQADLDRSGSGPWVFPVILDMLEAAKTARAEYAAAGVDDC